MRLLATILADYCPETAVARELVLRLASLLWRLRRATAIETDLFEIQAESDPSPRALRRPIASQREGGENAMEQEYGSEFELFQQIDNDYSQTKRRLTYSFLHLANLDSNVFERLNRYEVSLWRQAVQIIFALQPIKQR